MIIESIRACHLRPLIQAFIALTKVADAGYPLPGARQDVCTALEIELKALDIFTDLGLCPNRLTAWTTSEDPLGRVCEMAAFARDGEVRMFHLVVNVGTGHVEIINQ